MGLSRSEGFEFITSACCLRYAQSTHNQQYHVDLIGFDHYVQTVMGWCHQQWGPPSRWTPLNRDAQWHNRFDTDLLRLLEWRWTCLRSPWTGGDINNVHLVFWDDTFRYFDAEWHLYQFHPWSTVN